MWRRNGRMKSQVEGVITEAEWLLAGHSAVGYVVSGRYAPAWSLVGVLAHRDSNQLQQLSLAGGLVEPGSWTATLADLAKEVLTLAPNRRALLRLQRGTLIPLELHLLRCPENPARTPNDLADLVLEALDAGRHSY